jgi:acyl-CoA thioesterase YciA
MTDDSIRPHATLPTDKELVLKVIPMPADTNGNGDIFGGWVMAQVDLAGAVLPARLVQGRMATVAVKEFVFKQPVRVGRTSVTVDVEVYAEGFHAQGQYVKVTEALLTYVAIDGQGKPQSLPDNDQVRSWRAAAERNAERNADRKQQQAG